MCTVAVVTAEASIRRTPERLYQGRADGAGYEWLESCNMVGAAQKVEPSAM
jgi:hypothetical protein